MEVVRLEPLPVIRELLLRQEAPHDGYGLLRPRQRLLNVYAVTPLHEPDSTGAQAERSEPAAGQVVNAARTHRKERWRPRVEVDDRRAQADRARLPSEDGQHGKSVLARLFRRAERCVAEPLPLLDP